MTSYILITSLLLLKKYTRNYVKNKMEEKKRKSPAFRIELPGDDEKKLDITDKMKLNRLDNNCDIITHLLDEYMLKKGQGNHETEKMPSTYVNAPKNAVNEPFLVNENNIGQAAVMELPHCANNMLLINLSRPISIVILFSIRSDNYALSSLSVAQNRI